MSDWQNEPHDHDPETGECIPPQGDGFYAPAEPTWRFSWWDVAGIATTTASGLIGALGNFALILNQGGNLLAREFNAMANYERGRFDDREAALAEEAARQQMSESLERMSGMDTLWLQPDEPSEDPS